MLIPDRKWVKKEIKKEDSCGNPHHFLTASVAFEPKSLRFGKISVKK